MSSPHAKRPPLRAAAPEITDQEIQNHGTPDHRELVSRTSVVELIDALADDPFGRGHDGYEHGIEWFRCPRCEAVPHNKTGWGAARASTDDWRWHCTWCRHQGTRYDLENLVLADAVALDRLIRAAMT